MILPPPTPVLEVHKLDWFILDERELSRHDDPEASRLLGEDMLANGQLHACGAMATPDGSKGHMISGHGRWKAAKIKGIETLEVKVYPASLTPTQLKLLRASENLQRREVTSYRKFVLCAELLAENADWQFRDLAAALHVDASMVTRLLSASRCIPTVVEEFRKDVLKLRDVYAISQLPAENQQSMLDFRLGGGTLAEVEQKSRKARKPATEQVKASRAKLALPSGVQIVVTGDDLDLDSLLESLAEAGKEIKRARDQGLNIKTLQAVFKDKATKE